MLTIRNVSRAFSKWKPREREFRFNISGSNDGRKAAAGAACWTEGSWFYAIFRGRTSVSLFFALFLSLLDVGRGREPRRASGEGSKIPVSLFKPSRRSPLNARGERRIYRKARKFRACQAARFSFPREFCPFVVARGRRVGNYLLAWRGTTSPCSPRNVAAGFRARGRALLAFIVSEWRNINVISVANFSSFAQSRPVASARARATFLMVDLLDPAWHAISANLAIRRNA